jgi:hypothetical protein
MGVFFESEYCKTIRLAYTHTHTLYIYIYIYIYEKLHEWHLGW